MLLCVDADSQHVKVSIQAVAKGTAAAPAELEADVEEVDSDTSSESDTEQIADINQMREIIARMDDDNDGVDQDKCALLDTSCKPLTLISCKSWVYRDPLGSMLAYCLLRNA